MRYQPTPPTVAFDRVGHHLTAYITGELDADGVPSIDEAIVANIGTGIEHLWLDMSATTFCDSTGLLMLFKLHRLTVDAGADFVIYRPSMAVRRVIELTDPDRTLCLHPRALSKPPVE